jgi:hypothetical protein
MDVLIERCTGLDVHRDTVVATVRRPGPGGARCLQTRTFSTMTGALEELAEWLVSEKVTLAGMESTGVETSTTIHDEIRAQLQAQARAQVRPRIQG